MVPYQSQNLLGSFPYKTSVPLKLIILFSASKEMAHSDIGISLTTCNESLDNITFSAF